VGDTIWSDIKSVGTDALLLFGAPARFDARGWGAVAGVAGGTALATLVDDPVRRLFATGHNATKDRLADVGNTMGTVLPAGAITGGVYLGGLLFDAPEVRRTGLHVAQSVLYATAITTVVKTLLGRQRPFLNGGPYIFHGPTFRDDWNSLPSGHTTLAFALCSSLAADIDRPWATVGLYGIAALTGLSRIYVDRHWASDVVLGAAVGTACGYGVVHLHDASSGATGFYLLPLPNGIGIAGRF
jgi:membrane-associated phospholipid phosphatase